VLTAFGTTLLLTMVVCTHFNSRFTRLYANTLAMFLILILMI